MCWFTSGYAAKTTGYGVNHPVDSASNVFVRVVSSKPAVYVGEAFIVKYQLCSAVAVIDPQAEVDLKFKDCYQELYPPDASQHTETINGKLYSVVTLKQYLLIAHTIGKLLLPKLKIAIKLRSPVVEDFFGQEEMVSKILITAPASVMVNALPVTVGSIPFSNAVGSFVIKASYSPSVKVPNLLIFRLVLDGQGNTKNMTVINPVLPQGLDIYNPARISNDTLTALGIKTQLTYSFQIVANYRGRYDIPGLTLMYFDQQQNKYKFFASPPIIWTVNKGPVAPHVVTAGGQIDNPYVKTDINGPVGKIYVYTKEFFFLLFLTTLLVFYCNKSALINKWFKKMRENTNRRSARRQALRHLKAMMRTSADWDDKLFCKQLIEILHQFLLERNAKFKEEVSGLLYENSDLLRALPAAKYNQIIAFIDTQNRARFSASGASIADRDELGSQLMLLIRFLDKK